MFSVLLKSFTFLFIIFLGYGLKRLKFFGKDDYKVVSKIVLNITLPAAIIHAFGGFERDLSLFFIVLMGLLFSFIPLITAFFLSSKDKKETRIFKMINTSGFNMGCFTLPMIQAFFGAAGVVPTCMFDIGNSMMMTGGSYTITSSLLHTDGKEKTSIKQIAGKLFSSVPFDVYMTMLVFAVLNIQIPDPIIEVSSVFANANSFMAMLMIGLMFELKASKEDIKNIAQVVLTRNAFAVVFSLIIYFLLPFPLAVRQVLAVGVFAPIGSLAPIFTEKCHGDGALSSLAGSVSIIISIIMMTGLVLFMNV